jgi:hypothetical protein
MTESAWPAQEDKDRDAHGKVPDAASVSMSATMRASMCCASALEAAMASECRRGGGVVDGRADAAPAKRVSGPEQEAGQAWRSFAPQVLAEVGFVHSRA